MKTGMTSLTLRNYSIEDVIRYVKEAGIDGIEWGVSDGHMPLCDAEKAEAIKALSKENGVEIFSLGSYCYMETREECDRTLETAVLLEAPIIRVWAGKKSPDECDEAYINTIVENTVYMAEQAAKHGIVIGFEYHHNTLTETVDSAIELVKKADSKNAGLYWQPRGELTAEQNITERNAILPYCVGNMHVQNYNAKDGYQMLGNIEDRLKTYFGDIKNKDYRVMIEFVKDGKPENLFEDAETLTKILA